MKLMIGNYRVTRRDKYNFSVREQRIIISEKGKNKGKKKKIHSDPKHFPKLEQLLNYILNQKIGDSDASDLQQVLIEIQTVKNEILQAVYSLDK